MGESFTSSGFIHAFLWENGEMKDLGTLGGSNWSWAVAINDKGQVLGYSSLGTTHAFIWENGVMKDFWPDTNGNVYLSDINNKGQMVGFSDSE